MYRFISGLDEMALPCEMGLYFDFNVTADGTPSGCPGFEKFSKDHYNTSMILQPIIKLAKSRVTSKHSEFFSIAFKRLYNDME